MGVKILAINKFIS